MNNGWICPKCQRVYSPSTAECATCNQSLVPHPYLPTPITPCAIEEFFKNNPGEKAAYISCMCPRCTPQYQYDTRLCNYSVRNSLHRSVFLSWRLEGLWSFCNVRFDRNLRFYLELDLCLCNWQSPWSMVFCKTQRTFYEENRLIL